MFVATTVLQVKVRNHPIETTIKKWLLRVPGRNVSNIFFQNKLLTPISNPISPSLKGSSCDDPVKLTKRKVYEVGLVERISGFFSGFKKLKFPKF